MSESMCEVRCYVSTRSLALCLVLIFSCLGFSLAQSTTSSGRPNIVIIVADDLGWNDIGYHNSSIRTPTLDRLARSGVVFDRFYVYPLCSPTRAGLMTARSSMRTGIIYSVVRPWANYGLALDEHLLPESFRAAGYQTAIIGKWHLGHDRVQFLPHNRGFDFFYGYVNGAIDYWTHKRFEAVDWQQNGVTDDVRGYSTLLLGEQAVHFIENRDTTRPFLLYLAFNAPHGPLQAPESSIAKYAELTDKKRQVFSAMVDVLDSTIDKVMQALRENGLEENTIVLFFSDNGGFPPQGGDNRPLRGRKETVFEGGIRVPAFIRWPGAVVARTSRQVMTVLDVFPTLAEAARVPVLNSKPLDGKSLWHEIVTGEVRLREDLFFAVEHDGLQHAVIHGRWKLVQIEKTQTCEVSNMLFDLEADPNEAVDLSQQQPDLVKLLSERIQQWRKLHPDGGIRLEIAPHPGWVPPADWAAAARR
ncbi:MAG: arylsulfatase [Acidobacteriota bacterium]